MISSHYASDPIFTKMPTWLAILLFLCVALLFAVELAFVSAISGWWLDDLTSLWASERTLPFTVAFRERILPDSNPPLYFSLLYFVRQIISDDGVAVFVLNVGAIIAASLAVYIPSRRLGLNGLAIAGIAAFVLSGPVLYCATEGRSYVMALSVVFVTSWYASLAITGFLEQLSLTRSIVLGCLGALTHVYAALFCGSLAAAFVALAVFSGRKERLKPGLALGLSAAAVFGIWLSIAFDSVKNIDWIRFTVRSVLDAALSVKELAFGTNLQAILIIALFAFGLLNVRTRSLFTVFCITLLLFTLLPVITSFVRPIITSRYWLIGAAALPVLMCFAARFWILEGFAALSRKSLIAGVAAVCFLFTSSALGFANARHYTFLKPIWRGADIVRPFLSRCPAASVHVYYGNSNKPYEAWESGIYGFSKLTRASPTLFADPQEDSTSHVPAEASSCPVLGWAEHTGGLKGLNDSEILKLMKIDASPDDVEFVRHHTGFVILKRRQYAPAS